MPGKLSQNTASENVFTLGFSLSFIGLFFSPFLTSLGTAILLLSIALNAKQFLQLKPMYLVLYIIPVLFVMTDLLRDGSGHVVQSKLLLALGFAVTAYACAIHARFLRGNRHVFFALCFGLVLFINLASVAYYFSFKEELDSLLLQSKSIPVFGGMHHIHFGVINAMAIGIALFYIFHPSYKKYSLMMTVVLILLLVSFHILSSRTGTLSLYLSLFSVLLFYSFREKAWKQAVIGIALLIGVNLLALTFSSSFKNKISNSVEDIQSWEKGAEAVNYKSMGMRLEAYRISWEVVKANLLMGVGAAQMEQQMQAYYISENSGLYPENRVGPHNQLLEFGMKYGMLGMLYVLLFYLYWVNRSLQPVNYGLLLMVLIIIVSSQFESLLERQVSLFLTASILPLSAALFSEEN